ncbi:MAG: aminomethyl-transferring glycine dehydrogenase subunit GcvPB [Clostridiales bacterium]|nr:aminomethyl-transferring glycine dehydrogenase subunit GcvPB [Clostridiales bacterium]
MSGLIFDLSKDGRRCSAIPKSDIAHRAIPGHLKRDKAARLAQVAEIDLVRHYTALSRQAFGVDNGFYPLGSCTMKYNPKVNEDAAALKGFTQVHPLQAEETVQGSLEAMHTLSEALCEITGMDAASLQPAAGAQGEVVGLAIIKAYLQDKGQTQRDKLIVPDSAHGTNPASAAMTGFKVINIPSTPQGRVDLEALKSVVGDDTAALMLTNPNTVGLFDENVKEIAKIVHDAGGMVYYDGANLNAVMGLVRPGDTGFDVVHLNLHKTFSTPHGGGGPGSGPVACKNVLAPFLPGPIATKEGDTFSLQMPPKSIGRVRAFYGNFLVNIRALAYILTLGAEGIPEAAQNAVLNANYMMEKLKDIFPPAFDGPCMHEFVISIENLKKEKGITAADIAKGLIDRGIHPPTMYFPLIVSEALMIEPTETESRETLDKAIAAFRDIYDLALNDPDALKEAPITTPVGRPDETKAVRNPVLKYEF